MYSDIMRARLQEIGEPAVRDGKAVLELLNFSDSILLEDIKACDIPPSFSTYHCDTLRFKQLFSLDKMTRRAIWTFDPGVACVAAISIVYISDVEWITTVVFRSSDIVKLDADLNWVKQVVTALNLEGHSNRMEVYFLNVHSYI